MIEAIETVLTIAFAAVALLSGVGFVLFRQPVYAALSFATAVLAASALYILQNAAYVAAATMVVYAGATIIIFLFVLMFAQHSHLQSYELKYSNLGVALVASLCLCLLLGYAVTTRGQIASGPPLLVQPPTGSAPTSAPPASGEPLPSETKVDSQQSRAVPTATDSSVAALGRVTYTRYLWSIELAGTLLLIAAGGAIVIAHREPHAIQTTGASL
ncbi:MAG: NADH-quinone oxidoreductase subunit J family protein [Aureliella sp.]